MIITALNPCRKSMTALHLDGEYALKLDTQTVLENRLAIGMELSDDELHELVEESDIRRAKEKALWLISYRDHSSKELSDKLSRDFSENATDKAVCRMNELGLINDEAFARKYAAELHSKHKSPREIKQKLLLKGIDRDFAQEIVEELGIDPLQEIRTLIEKKYIRSLSDEKGRRRTVSALQRGGYRWSDIKAVLGEFSEYPEDDYC